MSDEGGSMLTAGSPAAAAPANGTNGDAADWRSGLPEDIRADPVLQQYKDIPSLAKGHIETKRMVGAAFQLPKDDAPESEWDQKLFSRLRPESPDKYELAALPDGQPFDEEMAKEFRTWAHKNGLHPKQASGLYNAYNEFTTSRVAAFQKELDEGISALRSEWGGSFEQRIGSARRAVEKYGGDDLKQALDDFGLGDHPAFVRAFAKMGEAMREDSGTVNVVPSGESRALIEQKINAILSDPKHPFNDRMATHESHKRAVQEYQDLHDQLHRAR